ncbi:MAG: hypothetical protein K8E24_015125 [Methanobacterium paludis]|nr:hypothetical protein [Methanobacterium paludis]
MDNPIDRAINESHHGNTEGPKYTVNPDLPGIFHIPLGFIKHITDTLGGVTIAYKPLNQRQFTRVTLTTHQFQEWCRMMHPINSMIANKIYTYRGRFFQNNLNRWLNGD